MTDRVAVQQAGLTALLQQPLIESIFRRRTHRVSRGSSLSAGSMSYVSTSAGGRRREVRLVSDHGG